MVAAAIRATGGVVAGFIDRAPAGSDQIDEAAFIAALTSGALPFDATRVALGIGDNRARLAAWKILGSSRCPSLVHRTAWVEPDVAIGSATVVLPYAVLHSRTRVGAAVIINTGAIVEHDCVVGDAVHVAPGAIVTGGVTVEDGAWIGAGAVVLPGLRIGVDAVVGAGAVVTRDVAAGVTVVGTPARSLRKPQA